MISREQLVISYLVDSSLVGIWGWRWMFGLAVIPAVVLGIGMFFMPREIVGVYVGARSKQGARGLWNYLPSVYCRAVCSTDFWASYQNVIPKERHRAVFKLGWQPVVKSDPNCQ